MVGSNIDEVQGKEKESSDDFLKKRNLPWIFLFLLIVSIVGYFYADSHWVEFIFAHLGGLFIIGLIGYFSGFIAMKKGYGSRNALLIGIIFPIVFGFIAAILFEPISCGGSISLGVAVFIVIIYSIVKSRAAEKLT